MKENFNFTDLNNNEDDDEEDEDQPKKSSSLTEIISPTKKSKEKVSRDIVKSLFKTVKTPEEPDQSLFKTTKTPEEPDQKEVAATETIPVDGINLAELHELSPEEEVLVNKSIAEQHLEQPITNEAPTELVTDFLEQVVEGSDPSEAYNTTIEENQLADLGNRSIANQEQPTQFTEQPTQLTEQPTQLTEQQTIEHKLGAPLEAPNYTNELTAKRTLNPSVNVRKRPAVVSSPKLFKEPSIADQKAEKTTLVAEDSPPTLSTNLSSYILGRREINKQAETKKGKTQKVVKQIESMERNISQKELTIQQMALSPRPNKESLKKTKLPQTELNSEKINASKPIKIEHLGRVMIETEKIKDKEKLVKPNLLKQKYRPEAVMTLNRVELLDLTEKITVEGASLKHMYENGLFSERALRRLAREYLKGKNIKQMLRKEILEKQLDYERDPELKDRINREDKLNQDFEQTTTELNTSSIEKNKQKIKIGREEKLATTKQVASDNHVFINFLLAVIVIVLIAVIIYLLLVK